ncbi:MAG: NAD(P)H-hydrate dehydratase [Erythrobacter sp.]
MSLPTSDTPAQVLTAQQMRAAEQELFDTGTSVTQLMEIAAGGAAEWVRRIAGGRPVTVLCGPGNNGGDGYVIARLLREAGNPVEIVAPLEPKTDAAKAARDAFDGEIRTSGGGRGEGVFVDCLFGSGLSRPLEAEHSLLLRDLSGRHAISIAIDVPSGFDSDSGEALNERLPQFDVTLALGVWKFAHCLQPGRGRMGTMRLVPIGVAAVEGAARKIQKPRLRAPAADTHKYRRGLVAILGGEMPGAAILAALAAQRAGAGYTKLVSSHSHPGAPPDLVVDDSAPVEALEDDRIDAVLIGPGLGRGGAAKETLGAAMQAARPTVIDADALVLLAPDILETKAPVIATPHDGELETLCRSFHVVASGRKDRAIALAKTSGMIVLAKGPDSFIAAPDGRLAIAPPTPSWLSTAGTGDVLAGIIASRLATGAEPFDAACEAVWMHGEAARRCGAAFTAEELARAVSEAFAACL